MKAELFSKTVAAIWPVGELPAERPVHVRLLQDDGSPAANEPVAILTDRGYLSADGSTWESAAPFRN